MERFKTGKKANDETAIQPQSCLPAAGDCFRERPVFGANAEANQFHRFVYARSDWFKINTPIGSYIPDWAVLIEDGGEQKLYFVLESKGNILPEALRPTEHAKIQCGDAHFRALGNEVIFKAVDNFDHFLEEI